MKKQSMYVAFLTTLTMMASAYASAQARTVAAVSSVPATTTSTISTASVKHLGNPPGSVVFQVLFDNPSGEKFSVTIRDTDGATLYQDNYTDKKFDKKYQLPKEQAEKLKFIIKGTKTNQVQTFEVNSTSRIIEELVVLKVG